MSRIEGRFAALRRDNRKALIPYIVAGDPLLSSTVPLMHKLVHAGADIIELGVPFSDPMAEGPTIQQGHERALANGVSLRSILAMVAEFRSQDQATPVLLMGYVNPVLQMGYARFADAAAEAGVDALLTVDMPAEEVGILNPELQRVGIDNIFLVAPNTPLSRIEKVAEVASGFLYYVSLKGVTGAGNLDTAQVADRVGEIRLRSDLPVAVGFGIKDAASAVAVARIADGVVIGSALVQLVADTQRDSGEAAAIEAASRLVASIRAGLDAG